MTPQEAQMLQDLVRKVEGTQLTEKDPDAEALLADGLARDPDALYKLAQTVLVQNLALNQARAQIDQMRQQPVLATPQPARATSFLGSLLGHRDPQSAPPPPQYQQPPQYAPPQYQTVPQYAAAPPTSYAPAPSGAGSFLRSAATTAAGVAAGALAFEGIESLIHGGEHGGFMGGGFGPGYGGGYGAPVEETVVNNYYGDSNDQVPGPDEQPQGNYNDSYVSGPDEQPQGGDDSYIAGPDEQPQDNYDSGDSGGFSDDSGSDFV